jgi:chemotaxis protein MotB
MSRRKASFQSGDPNVSTNTWMITFSDLCTLLLTFFVLVFSMSSLNERAFRSTFQNFDKSSGIMKFKTAEEIGVHPALMVQEMCKNLESLQHVDVKDIQQINMSSRAYHRELELLASGRSIWFNKQPGSESFSFIFGQQLLFESGDATLNPKAYPILEGLAKFMRDGNYQFFIDGHTDTVPIHNLRFASNDDLSLARSQAVMDFFVHNCSVNPKLFALGGYGGSHPLIEKTTPAAQAVNRRVEIIFRKGL